MADNDIQITFLAKQSDLLDALVKQQAAMQKSVDKLSKIGETGKKTGDQLGTAFEKGTQSALKWVSGIAGAGAVFSSLISQSTQLYEITDAAAQKLAEMDKRFAVQSGLRGLEGEAAQKRILAMAEKNAVTPEVANQAAVALASGGFSAGDASGGALDVMLQAMQASLKGGEDPTGLAQSAGQFLAAQGMNKNAGNLKRIMVASQQLFKTTDFQISDLTSLASKSQGAAGIMSPEEVLGTFNVMRDKTSAEVASTGFKILMERLQTAKSDPQSVSALRKLGLKPEQVDFQGEGISQILESLGTGLDKLKPEQRPIEMEKLFGREALSPITGLIRDRAKIPANVAAMGNVAGFDEDVAMATSGKTAGRARLEAREKRRQAEADTGFADRVLVAKDLARNAGGDEISLGISAMVAKSVAAASRVVMSSDNAEALGIQAGFGHWKVNSKDVDAGVSGSRDPAEKQLKLLEEIAKNTGKPPVVLKPGPGLRAVPAAAGLDAGVRGSGGRK